MGGLRIVGIITVIFTRNMLKVNTEQTSKAILFNSGYALYLMMLTL